MASVSRLGTAHSDLFNDFVATPGPPIRTDGFDKLEDVVFLFIFVSVWEVLLMSTVRGCHEKSFPSIPTMEILVLHMTLE